MANLSDESQPHTLDIVLAQDNLPKFETNGREMVAWVKGQLPRAIKPDEHPLHATTLNKYYEGRYDPKYTWLPDEEFVGQCVFQVKDAFDGELVTMSTVENGRLKDKTILRAAISYDKTGVLENLSVQCLRDGNTILQISGYIVQFEGLNGIKVEYYADIEISEELAMEFLDDLFERLKSTTTGQEASAFDEFFR